MDVYMLWYQERETYKKTWHSKVLSQDSAQGIDVPDVGPAQTMK